MTQLEGRCRDGTTEVMRSRENPGVKAVDFEQLCLNSWDLVKNTINNTYEILKYFEYEIGKCYISLTMNMFEGFYYKFFQSNMDMCVCLFHVV